MAPLLDVGSRVVRPSRARRRHLGATSVLALAAALGLPALASAQTPPATPPGGTPPPGGGMTGGPAIPTGADFDISYWVTAIGPESDPDEPDQVRPMTTVDYSNFVNIARCQCNHKIAIRVRLKQGMYDATQPLVPYIGYTCPDAEANVLSRFPRCLSYEPGFTTAFATKLRTYYVDPIWFSTGPTDDTRDAKNPVPKGDCEGPQVVGGFWMCALKETQCTGGAADFIVKPSNLNPMLMNVPGLKVDFRPPLGAPDKLTAKAGDGAMELSWGAFMGSEVAGFRILCAKDGKPVPGKWVSPPDPTAQNRGTSFYTAETVCGDPKAGTSPVTPTTSGGTNGTDAATGTDTTSATTDTSTTGAAEARRRGRADLAAPEDVSYQTTTVGPTTVDSTGGAVTSSGGTGTASDVTASGTGGTSSVITTGAPPPEPGDVPKWSLPLPWRYVCSGHIPVTGSSVRIDGLTNLEEYEFVLVAYDASGNGIAAASVKAIPEETNGFWEQCEDQGDTCGEAGFCACTTTPPRALDLAGWAAFLGFFFRRVARRVAAAEPSRC